MTRIKLVTSSGGNGLPKIYKIYSRVYFIVNKYSYRSYYKIYGIWHDCIWYIIIIKWRKRTSFVSRKRRVKMVYSIHRP